MSTPSPLLCAIALGAIPGVGAITARKLIEATGSPEALFSEKASDLALIAGITRQQIDYIVSRRTLELAEREAGIITAKGITPLLFTDAGYPRRLAECPDAPLVIYYRGECDLNSERMISVVGTRRATSRGRDLCEDIIGRLASRYPDLVVVSGLAYGIDIAAHRAALTAGVRTLGVLAHGHGTIYPGEHRRVAGEMVERGGLLTDFLYDESAERGNFIKRNRIIAGISAGTLVVESGVKGGAMVTAEMAFSYGRDVMALPGRSSDNWSLGCNRLIKRNISALIESGDDISDLLGWESVEFDMPRQQLLFGESGGEELAVADALRRESTLSADEISRVTGIAPGRLSSLLLNMELRSAIRSYPGNRYGPGKRGLDS